MFTVQSA